MSGCKGKYKIYKHGILFASFETRDEAQDAIDDCFDESYEIVEKFNT